MFGVELSVFVINIYIINQLNKPQQPAAHTQQSEDEQKTIHQQNTQNYILNFIDLRQKIA